MRTNPRVFSRWAPRFLVAGLVVLLAVGAVSFLRLPSGSAFPNYSSSRTDAFGTSLLFDALQRSGQVTATRNYLPPGQPQRKSATILYLGLSSKQLLERHDPLIGNAQREANGGNRVILGFVPERSLAHGGQSRDGKLGDAGDSNTAEAIEGSLPGVFLRRFAAPKDRPAHIELEPDGQWQPLASPLAWERRFGAGAIVLLDGADRLTNRSLATVPEAQHAIPTLIGDRRAVIFDESHLGVAETGSVAALARRYRLTGLLIGLLLLTGLFLWRSAVPFPPLSQAATLTPRSLRADKLSALAGLLGRHMEERSALAACIAEWNRIHPHRLIQQDDWKQSDPAAAYRALTQTLQQRKRASS